MIKQLYTVESGEYSDNAIHAVFDDKTTAEAWAKAYREYEDSFASDAEVRTIPFVSSGVEPYTRTIHSIHQTVFDDGSLDEKREWPITSLAPSVMDYPRLMARYVRAPIYNGKGGRIEVRGEDLDKVRNTFAGKVAAVKDGTWGGPGNDLIEEVIEP